MGTIIQRTRKDGSKAFTAQIVIKKAGAIVHRELLSFDRKQAANAWIVKREAELKRPGGLEQKEDPTLSAVIDRYIAESNNVVLGTKAQVLKAIKNSDLGETKCSEITSQTLVSFARDLTRSVEPQTCGHYFSHFVEHSHCCPTSLGLSAIAPGIRRCRHRHKEAWPDKKSG